MVLYDAMVLLSAKVPKSACADVLRRLGTQVMDRGGVVTDVVSYGARTLAYEFRKPGEKHFEVRGARVRAVKGVGAGGASGGVGAGFRVIETGVFARARPRPRRWYTTRTSMCARV